MTTSEQSAYSEAFVWIWLPNTVTPVVAGRLAPEGGRLIFNYGKSYLSRQDAIAIHTHELPLQEGPLPLLNGLTMPGCLRDSAPDAWGRRVILNKVFGIKGAHVDSAQLNELAYMLESGSDRIGALDFQSSATAYMPRITTNVTLAELQASAERVERGIPLTPDLDQALHHASSIGGARPKALVEGEGKKYVAKFSTSSDLYSVVKAEFLAMRLAHHAGLHVAPVRLERSAPKDVLLIERFDRLTTPSGWSRRGLVSALTLLGLDEMMARYASYQDLAEIIRFHFRAPKQTLRELFGRIVFNILCGNTDDHARNHAALWDGRYLTLSPAYDICPQSRSGQEASQAMLIHGNDRSSRLATCLLAADTFFLARTEASALIGRQISSICKHWRATCAAVGLSDTDRHLLWRRQFLNPYAFKDLGADDVYLRDLVNE